MEGFKAIFPVHPSGVATLIADAGDRPVAPKVSSVASVNAEPPLLVFSVSGFSSSSAALSHAETVVVLFLNAQDLEVTKLDASSGIDGIARAQFWTKLATAETGYNGVSILAHCWITERVPAAYSTWFTARSFETHVARDATPGDTGDALVHRNRKWHNVGDNSRIEPLKILH